MRHRLFSFLGAGFFLFFAFVHVVFAYTTTTEGCFVRASSPPALEIWMTTPHCTLTIENVDVTNTVVDVTVLNLDAEMANVQSSGSVTINSIARNQNILQFSVEIIAGENGVLSIAPEDEDPNVLDFWFGAISDPQETKDGDVPNPVFVKVMNDLQIIHPNFIVVSGDIIEGDEVDAELHADMYDAHETLLKTFEGTTVQVPGDHDRLQSLDTYYSQYFGPRNVTFVYGSTRFIGFSSVDDVEEGRVDATTLSWLHDTLNAATEEHIIVFMHHALFPPDWANSGGIITDQRTMLAQMFVAAGVDLVINGDVHGYDDRVIDGMVVPGLSGSFEQLIVGGAGGQITKYKGGHFFTLVHVTSEGITHIRVDLSAFDVSFDYDEVNDGTNEVVNVRIFNNGSLDIPFVRTKIRLSTDSVYAFQPGVGFFALSTVARDTYQLTTLTTSVDAHDDQEWRVGVERNLVMGVRNDVTVDGRVSFSTLPLGSDIVTDMTIERATTPLWIKIDTWNTDTQERRWVEHTATDEQTSYRVTGLDPYRSYRLMMKSRVYDIIVADNNGNSTFDVRSARDRRELSLVPQRIQPAQIAALPTKESGANAQFLNAKGDVTQAFFTFQNRIGGFSSLWADVNGDNELEFVTWPHDDQTKVVRIFNQDQKLHAEFFPFGKTFAGKIFVVAGNIDADANEELLFVAPHEKLLKIMDVAADPVLQNTWHVSRGESVKALYTADVNDDGVQEIFMNREYHNSSLTILRVQNGELKKSIRRVLPKSQTFSSLTAGDVDRDGKDEILAWITGTSSHIRIYDVQLEKKRMKLRGRIASESFLPIDSVVQLLVTQPATVAQNAMIVAVRSSSSLEITNRIITIATTHSARHGKVIATQQPFGQEYVGALDVVMFDADHNGTWEIAGATADTDRRVRTYQWTNQSWERTSEAMVYDSGFTNGITLTNW